MWPLTMYDLTLTRVEKMEMMITSYVRKWLGLPRCFSSVSKYEPGLLQLTLSILTEEFKCTAVRLEITLTESKETAIRAAAPTLETGKKWSAKSAVQQAKSAPHHIDIVGQVQHGRGGLGLGEKRSCWNKSASRERWKVVAAEVRQQEESSRCAKAVSQVKRGQWMSWESVEKQTISWKDMWEMESSRISFLIRSIYPSYPYKSQPMGG